MRTGQRDGEIGLVRIHDDQPGQSSLATSNWYSGLKVRPVPDLRIMKICKKYSGLHATKIRTADSGSVIIRRCNEDAKRSVTLIPECLTHRMVNVDMYGLETIYRIHRVI